MARTIEKGAGNSDCIWIERPFVARNVGADERGIGISLGEYPEGLDRLRIEKKNEAKARAERGKRNSNLFAGSDGRKGGKKGKRKGTGEKGEERGRERSE